MDSDSTESVEHNSCPITVKEDDKILPISSQSLSIVIYFIKPFKESIHLKVVVSMDSDSDTTESVNASSYPSSPVRNISVEETESTDEESLWDRVQRLTYAGNVEYWSNLLSTDETLFRLRFKESFLESCRTWLASVNDFVENDSTWSVLMVTKAKLFKEIPEDDEALLSAIDKRKYKLFKLIDWEQLEADLTEDSNEESDTGNEVAII